MLTKLKLLLNDGGNSLKYRLLTGAFWSVFGSSLAKLINLFAYIFLARIISQEAYGELGLIRSTLNMFAVVSGMGLGYTATKFIAQYRDTNPNYAGNIYSLSNFLSIFIGAIGVICLFCFSDEVAVSSLNAPHLTSAVKLGAIVLFFTTINGIQSGALYGFEAFKEVAINHLLTNVCQSILIVVLGYYYGVNGCVLALGIGCFILGVLNKLSINKKLKKHGIFWSIKNIDIESVSVLWKFSIPTLLSSLMVTPVLWWAKTKLVNESNYEQMALFDVADQWSISVLFIPSALSQIVLPMLSNILSTGDTKQYNKFIKFNLLINFSFAFLIALIVALLSPYILKMYGPEYSDKLPLVLMMVATVCMSMCSVVGQVIASQGKMWLGFSFNLLWAIYMVFFTHFFSQYGASGLALTITCSYSIHFIGQLIYIYIKLYKS